MKHRPKEIVLAGGPCSWKSGGLKFLREKLPLYGLRPFLGPETPTMIINGGVPDIGWLQKHDFKKYVEVERAMLLTHLALRKEFYRLAQNFDNSVVVYDRGGMDQAAYLKRKYFDAILQEDGLTLRDVRDSYDKVIYLVTAAYGAEEFYTTANNEARQETTIEEARRVDDRNLAVWIGHPHLTIVPSNPDRRLKEKRLLKAVLHTLGIPRSREIERKFLLKSPPDFSSPAFKNSQKVFIEQMYLRKPGQRTFRIRKQAQGDSITYFKTGIGGENGKEAFDDFISATEYLDLQNFQIPGTGVIWKHRWYFAYRHQYFELDVFLRPEGFCFLEVELLDENEPVELPPFLEIEKEVTNDFYYSNYQIAKRQE